jgi:endo-1,4-beta-D-glucanase Y
MKDAIKTSARSLGLTAFLLVPLACGADAAPGNGGTGGSNAGAGGSQTGGSGGVDHGGSGGSGGGAENDAGAGTGGGDSTGGSVGSGGSTTGSGGGGSPAGYNFGSHPLTYPAGTIQPSGGQAALDSAVATAYDKWKAAYVTMGCGGYYIKTGPIEPNAITGSSANGAAMIAIAMMAGHDPEAQTIFDGFVTVARAFPSYLGGHDALLAYVILDGCKKINEGDSSTDGDLDFAFALLLADKQWGSGGKFNYLDEAKKTITQLKPYDMNPDLKLPRIGDWASLPDEPAVWKTSSKPPYFMLDHFRAYAKASGDTFWNDCVSTQETLIAKIQTMYSSASGLLPQFLTNGTTPPSGKLLSDANDGNYFGEAGRIPLRFAADYVVSGDAQTKAALAKINGWIKTKAAGDPTKIVDGYKLDGTPIGTKASMEFVASFGAGAIIDAADKGWLDAIWKQVTAAPAEDYEADTAKLLGMLVMSGNWWTP